MQNCNFCEGQVYVALSRSVGFDSLAINGAVDDRWIRTSAFVGRFYVVERASGEASRGLPLWDEEAEQGDAPDCHCGLPAADRTSQTPYNPGRPFYTCQAGKEGGGCEMFVWKQINNDRSNTK